MRRATTLVELLVVIAVIAVLIGLLAPALGLIRQRSFEIKSISNLSQIGITTGLYTNSFRTYYFGHSGFMRPDHPTDPGAIGFDVWSLDTNWPVLAHQVAPWRGNFEIWISPKSDSDIWSDLLNGTLSVSRLPVSYHYSNSFVADPRVWNVEVQRTKKNAIGATRPSQVAFPSSKVLMYDAHRSYLNKSDNSVSPRPLLFADGSARTRDDIDATPPVSNALRPGYKPVIYHDTPDGVRGRDY